MTIRRTPLAWLEGRIDAFAVTMATHIAERVAIVVADQLAATLPTAVEHATARLATEAVAHLNPLKRLHL